MNGSAPEPRLLDRSDTRVKHASSRGARRATRDAL